MSIQELELSEIPIHSSAVALEVYVQVLTIIAYAYQSVVLSSI